MPATRVRILADDLTGALDCAAAFGAGVPVHLGQPGPGPTGAIDIVATATRDVPAAQWPALLSPSLDWLAQADLAFKKVDSLLRGNTLDEVDWLARRLPVAGVVFAPAFPAQHRITTGGQHGWRQADGTCTPVGPDLLGHFRARGWSVHAGTTPPQAPTAPWVWVPDVQDDAALDALARMAGQTPRSWLWCGSAGLAHALVRTAAAPQSAQAFAPKAVGAADAGEVMLVSASSHPVTRAQWQVLQAVHGARCHDGANPHSLQAGQSPYPTLIKLSPPERLAPEMAAALLRAQAQALAAHAPRPRSLVVVGGDTLLALCQALGTTGLQSEVALARAGWGCARMLGGRWAGVVCHTRSGAFGGPQDLLDVLGSV